MAETSGFNKTNAGAKWKQRNRRPFDVFPEARFEDPDADPDPQSLAIEIRAIAVCRDAIVNLTSGIHITISIYIRFYVRQQSCRRI